MLLVIGYWGVFKFLGCFEFLSVKKFFVYWYIGILGRGWLLVTSHWSLGENDNSINFRNIILLSYRKRGFNLVLWFIGKVFVSNNKGANKFALP